MLKIPFNSTINVFFQVFFSHLGGSTLSYTFVHTNNLNVHFSSSCSKNQCIFVQTKKNRWNDMCMMSLFKFSKQYYCIKCSCNPCKKKVFQWLKSNRQNMWYKSDKIMYWKIINMSLCKIYKISSYFPIF